MESKSIELFSQFGPPVDCVVGPWTSYIDYIDSSGQSYIIKSRPMLKPALRGGNCAPLKETVITF